MHAISFPSQALKPVSFYSPLKFFLLTLIPILAGYSPWREDFLTRTRKGNLTKLKSEWTNSSNKFLLQRRSDLQNVFIIGERRSKKGFCVKTITFLVSGVKLQLDKLKLIRNFSFVSLLTYPSVSEKNFLTKRLIFGRPLLF